MLLHCYIFQKYRNDLESIFVHSLADSQIQILNGVIIYLPFFSWRKFAMKENWKLNWSDWWDYLCDNKSKHPLRGSYVTEKRPNSEDTPVAMTLDNTVVDWARAGRKSLIFVRLEHWT